ncbi:WD40-repeat-containing domain protein [Stachybotrys elegans]|uniref:WD40-repeat-containing domain protein n=1 Tax=Stachybotrys elegans TaxID=80388 RepID=A0A8K0SWM2_9HYPO|nr:WD40-repeat-containing domain protein [Stachybotrys elegans]
MTPSPSSHGLEPRRPRSAQTISVNFSESTSPNAGPSSQNGPRRFQLEVSECVETKTVTTTTRLTRKFPHVFVRDPNPLESLDTKEYPLAMKPTPPELTQFSYIMPPQDEDDDEDEVEHDDFDPDQRPMRKIAADRSTPAAIKKEYAAAGLPIKTPTSNRALRRSSRSPSDAYSRNLRQPRATRAESPSSAPTSAAIRPSHQLSRSSHLASISDKPRRSASRGASSTNAGTVGPSSSNGAVASSLGGNANSNTVSRLQRVNSGFLATPDTSELPSSAQAERQSRRRSINLDRSQTSTESGPTSQSTSSGAGLYDAASPAGSDSHTIFSSNVATPPVTDTDPDPFPDPDDSLPNAIRSFQSRPTIDIVAAQDASLPSPRLSPTLAAAQLHSAEHDDEGQSSALTTTTGHSGSWTEDTQFAEETTGMELARVGRSSRALARAGSPNENQPVVVDTQTLLEAFDSMKTEMKTFMMYQFLRRCPRPTLRVIADAVNPALKCDFIRQLPLELGYHVLSYLNHRDLCRAAQVSKHWRNIVDRNETGWKELFDRDGFTLSPGELNKAIVQGWGWQDPEGATGFERDMSMQNRLTSSEQELTRSIRSDLAPRSRSSKRKRGINAYTASERSKRRASAQQDAVAARDERSQLEARQHKSEGPLSAANAAAAAVPDPQLGLPSLRQLHLFKSLYRRHYMIRQSWTSGEVKPGHVAFAAHPRHVITCLQFDDDKIITGSDDTLIHVYDTKTGKLRKKLEGHEGGVWALQYEGNMLVSGSTDRSVRVWDIERGLCQQVFYGHTSTVRCLQILMPTETGKDSTGKAIMQPEKPLIITGSRDNHLRVWRLPEVGSRRYIQTGPPAQESDCPYFIRVLAGHTHSVRAISAHGDTLVSGSYDSTVRVWRISTGEPQHILQGHSQKVYSVVLDHQRNRCISGSMDSLVKIWDLATGSCLHTLEGHSLLVGLLDLRDERLVSAAADSTLRIWDPETGKCRNTLMAHTGAITCFQHDGRKVISGSEKTVKMWDVRTGECVQDLLTDLSGVWQVKFDERRCVAAVQRDQLTYVEVSRPHHYGPFRLAIILAPY